MLLLPIAAPAITVEVVQLYQPVSLHGTDGVGDDEGGEDAFQAAVFSRPAAISGAIPEDLVKAIAMPHKIISNSPAYDVEDANLLTLCKMVLTAEMKNDKLLVRLDLTAFTIPEDVDLTARQVVRLTIIAIRQTLTDYYRRLQASLEVSVGVIGTSEGNESLKDLAARFQIGVE
jgi:hypothetical protein